MWFVMRTNLNRVRLKTALFWKAIHTASSKPWLWLLMQLVLMKGISTSAVNMHLPKNASNMPFKAQKNMAS